MDVNNPLIDLFQSVQQGFGALAARPDPIEERIARIVNGAGQRVRMKWTPVSNEPKERDQDETRKRRRAAWFATTIDHKPLGPDSIYELYDVLSSDPVALREFMDHIMAMIDTGPRIWRNLLAAKLATATTAGTAYNGGAMLSTQAAPMYINPDRKELGTQFNFLPNTKADAAGITAALQRFDEMRGHDGQRLHVGDTTIVAVVPNRELERRVREVTQGSTIAVQVGANAAATIPNQLQGMISEVIRFSELNSYVPKRVHFLEISSDLHRALAVSKVRQPTPYLRGLNSTDPERTATYGGRIEAGWDAFGGVGFGLPQKLVGLEEP